MRMFRKDEGFTLVELMVVVLIIGILVAVAIPVFNSASASARKRACQANLRTLDGATEQWASANPVNDKTGLDLIADAKAALGTTESADGLTGVYVKNWDNVVQCPADATAAGVYTVTDGNFTCATADHNYENN